MKLLNSTTLCFILLVLGCKKDQSKITTAINAPQVEERQSEELPKVQVLNFGTFHMGFTSDANKTEFNEHDKQNQRKVHDIAKQLSAFKPTVIIVEYSPEYNDKLQAEYKSYVENPEMTFKNPSEVELLAYELGRLSGAERIYGIDHKMGYNYNIGNEITNVIDSTWYSEFYQNPLKYYLKGNVNEDDLDVTEKLRVINLDRYLDFLITVNADMLSHVGSEKGFEGADEAAKYYQRNLRMYSNLNRLDLKEADRVFILMGASHTAFFRDFMSRSPKYNMVNTFDYLK